MSDHSEFIAIYYSVAMTLRTLMLLVATAMAVVLAACSGSQQEDGSNSQHGSGSQASSGSQQSEAANTNSLDGCAGSGGADLRQEEGGDELLGGKIVLQPIDPIRTDEDLNSGSVIFVIDKEDSDTTLIPLRAA